MLKASVGNKAQVVSRGQEGNKASALNKVQGGKADKPGNKAQGGNKARLGNKAQGGNKARPGNKASVSNKAQGGKAGRRVWGVNKAWGVSAVQEVKAARPDNNRGSVVNAARGGKAFQAVNAAQFIRNNGPEEVPLQVLLFPAGFSVFPRDRRQGLHQDREVHHSKGFEYGVFTPHRVGWTSAWSKLVAGI